MAGETTGDREGGGVRLGRGGQGKEKGREGLREREMKGQTEGGREGRGGDELRLLFRRSFIYSFCLYIDIYTCAHVHLSAASIRKMLLLLILLLLL